MGRVSLRTGWGGWWQKSVLRQFVFKGQVIMALRRERPRRPPVSSRPGWNAMVLYADGVAHDGVVATAGTRDQISWWQRRWRRGDGLLRQAKRESFNTREIVASRPSWRARPRKEIGSYRRVRGIGSLSFPKGIGPEKNRGGSYLRSVAGWGGCVCDTW